MSTAELLSKQEYKYGFVTDIESDMIPRGLTEDTIRLIVEKKNEPDWMLEFRLKAFRHWLTMTEPKHWPNLKYPEIDYQNIIYYSAPKQKATKASLDEVDPELRLGISRNNLQRETEKSRRDLLFLHGSDQRLPGSHQEVSRLGGADQRQLFCGVE
jgi:Fe-S cluster assembly protein SufB